MFEKVYSYDDLGRLESYLYSLEGENNYTVTFDYLEGSEENSTTTLVKSMTIGGVVYEYTYDSLGNITEVTKTVGETTTVIQSYVYDSLNQLTRENNRETNQTVVFEYDNHGNILSKTVYPFTLAEIVSEGTTINYGYDSNWTDLLVNYNGQTITYDQIGNPLSYRDGMSFKWSSGRKLTSFTLNNGASYVNGSYVYDDSGIRVYKNINGNETKYYLNGSTILTEITNFGGVTRRVDYIYDESGSVYGFSVDGVDYYYIRNLQGDIIGILDKTGNLLVEYIYDAYGVPTVSFPGITEGMTDAEKNEIYLLGNNNPFRYRGYYFDVESGLYYLNSRYYDPVTGRFLNADGYTTTGQGVLAQNMFTYCANNPIMRVDQTGYLWKTIKNVWNGIKSFFGNIFGAGSRSSVQTDVSYENVPPILNLLVTVKSGTNTSTTLSENGDSSKLISVYSENVNGIFEESYAGAKLNISNFTLDSSIGLNNTGIRGAIKKGDKVETFGIKLDIYQFKIGFEGSTTTVAAWDSNTTVTTYCNASITGVGVLAIVALYYGDWAMFEQMIRQQQQQPAM